MAVKHFSVYQFIFIFKSWATSKVQEYWSGYPIPSPADLPDPGIEPGSPALQVDSLLTELSGKPQFTFKISFNLPGNLWIWFVVVKLLSHVWLFMTPWTVAPQASLSFTISQRLLTLMSIESVIPSSHLILCCPLFLLGLIFPSIKVFSSESALHIMWPNY